ncbi:MAG: LysE family translocator [Gaiellaceae bacterium]
MAVLLSLTPGPGMALVVRNAAVGGTGAAARTTVGSSIGVGVWAVLSALGVSALIATSEMAFVGLKIAGVVVLVWFGVQALRGSGDAAAAGDPARRDFASGLLTAVADFVCYVSLGAAVARASRSLARSRLARRIEQLTGAVLLALAGRLAYETR